ncbi:MAG: glycosyltransferase family 2 protein [Rhodobacteraceae bacterium]|nr:glycosyltransferase family 2 protein [Paracoccaceae bacterium]
MTDAEPLSSDDAALPPISCYIRTLNEERLIGEVIAAARKVSREVVIVDSGSTDRTCEIAADAGARVIEQTWLGNGFQKRTGEEACSQEWLLDLDADEILTPELIAEILALFDGGEPPLSVYRLTLVTAPPIGEPWTHFALDPRAKLYDKRRWRMPESRAWDQLALPTDAAVGALKGALMHHSFQDFAHYMAKWNGVSTRRAEAIKLKPLWLVRLRVLFAWPFYFLRHYILRGFWRGGLYGFAVAGGVAFGRWMRDVKMYEIHRRREEGPEEEA